MKILFISHDASKTGAPVFLLEIIKWLKENKPDLSIDILSLNGGPLENEFQKNCNNYINLEKSINNAIYAKQLHDSKFTYIFMQRIKYRLKIWKDKHINYREQIFDNLNKCSYNIIYANTIVSVKTAFEIKNILQHPVKLIAHIHELNSIIKLSLDNISKYLNNFDLICVGNNYVKNNLIENHKVTTEIQIINEFSNINPNLYCTKKSYKFTVSSFGSVHWRKGYDIFIQLARYINSSYSTCIIDFIWIGEINKEHRIIVDEDINKLGLNNITFLEPKDNYREYLNNTDVYIIASREEPFSVVALEAGLLGKPIICFDQGSGMAEFIRNGGGFVVPYLNIEALAEKIVFYYFNREKIKTDGNFNINQFRNFNKDTSCSEIYNLLKITNYNN